MKILFIQCFDSPGGQSNRSYLYAKELSKIGHNVSFFTNRYNHLDGYVKNTKEKSVKHFFAENKKYKNNKFLSVIINSFKLLKILKNNNFDVIIGSSVPLLNSFFALVAKNKKTKFIYDLRDVWPDALVFTGKLSKLNPIFIILKIMEIIIYKNSDGLISALPKAFKYVKKYNKSLPKIYLPNSYVPYPRYKKKFNKNKLKIMYIGRFQLDHNIKIILKSAKYILYEKKINNISFDLYGYGEDLDYIKKYKFENNLTNLKLKGIAKKNSINSISKKYDLALCTVSGSKIFKWGINLNKIYEYLNSSMPVIFSGKVPCNPVVKARCGFVCGSYNYIHLSKKIIIFNKLENNKKRKLSINAKNFFDFHYNIKIQIKKLDFFLKSL
jgi:hypothetical protein